MENPGRVSYRIFGLVGGGLFVLCVSKAQDSGQSSKKKLGDFSWARMKPCL